MNTFQVATADQQTLSNWQASLSAEFAQLKAKGLALDLTRGKPSSAQLDLSKRLDGILDGDYFFNGTDCRNYGGLDGLTALKQLFAPSLGADSEDMIIGGNSSLTMMYQTILFHYLYGADGPDSAWKNLKAPKFICPVPGYDRHFSICEDFGIEMLCVDLLPDGPDMDAVEAMLKHDPEIVGMWNVPRFSNPTGIVYSDECIQRIANLGAIAQAHFRVLWDNAYALHTISDTAATLGSISKAAKQCGNYDHIIEFGSTSKVTFAGAGVAYMACSEKNRQVFLKHLGMSSIGPDKVNQLRHLKFFSDAEGLAAHMQLHSELLQPRFAAVLDQLSEQFSDSDALSWTIPEGGYFISVDTLPGLASKVVALAADCGVKLTPAGATYPYGKDPSDKNIRLAPSFPSVADIQTAMEIFCCCVKLASVEQALAKF